MQSTGIPRHSAQVAFTSKIIISDREKGFKKPLEEVFPPHTNLAIANALQELSKNGESDTLEVYAASVNLGKALILKLFRGKYTDLKSIDDSLAEKMGTEILSFYTGLVNDIEEKVKNDTVKAEAVKIFDQFRPSFKTK